MFAILLMIIFYFPYLLALCAIHMAMLQGVNKRRMFPLSFWRLTARTAVGTLLGCIVGFGAGFVVMFGPSYMTGDFIGLPWLTMLPALGIGLCAAVTGGFLIGRVLVLRARPRHLYRAPA